MRTRFYCPCSAEIFRCRQFHSTHTIDTGTDRQSVSGIHLTPFRQKCYVLKSKILKKFYDTIQFILACSIWFFVLS